MPLLQNFDNYRFINFSKKPNFMPDQIGIKFHATFIIKFFITQETTFILSLLFCISVLLLIQKEKTMMILMIIKIRAYSQIDENK